MGTKQKPGQFDCYDKAENDEPMFVLLARDPVAPILVRHWRQLRMLLDIDDDDAKGVEADICANAMEVWASDHPDHGPFGKR